MIETEPNDQDAPSVMGSYAHGWDILKAHFWRLLLIWFLCIILLLPGSADFGGFSGILTSLYQFLVVVPLGFGLLYAFLVAVRGRSPEVGDLFAPFQRAYVSSILASILLQVAMGVAALPFIGALMLASLGNGVSGLMFLAAALLILLPIYAGLRLSFVPYLVVDEGYGPVEVLGESWSRTQAVQLQVIGIQLFALVVVLAGLLLLFVGVIPAMMLTSLAHATLYDDVAPVDADDEDDPTTPAPTAP